MASVKHYDLEAFFRKHERGIAIESREMGGAETASLEGDYAVGEVAASPG